LPLSYYLDWSSAPQRLARIATLDCRSSYPMPFLCTLGCAPNPLPKAAVPLQSLLPPFLADVPAFHITNRDASHPSAHERSPASRNPASVPPLASATKITSGIAPGNLAECTGSSSRACSSANDSGQSVALNRDNSSGSVCCASLTCGVLLSPCATTNALLHSGLGCAAMASRNTARLFLSTTAVPVSTQLGNGGAGAVRQSLNSLTAL
jgi:hypothetical protein